MKNKHILFIQGGGENGYEADKALVRTLQENLGKEYQVDYPRFESDETCADFGWNQQIEALINLMDDDLILVAHSFGASMTLKYLSENYTATKIQGIFLLATPFWSGNEKWQKGLQLKENFGSHLPAEVPVFFYHCQDDEEVPFSHFEQYKQRVLKAAFFEIRTGGHQFNNDLALVASQIKDL